jgi:hypothetical protein
MSKVTYIPITTAGNFLVVADKEGQRRVVDGAKRLPKGTTRIGGFAVDADANLFLAALYSRDNPPPKADDYAADAKSDAVDMAEHFLDEIVDQLFDDGKASNDYNNDYDGGDSYHHESHVDKHYHWKEAAELLSQLSEHEETDSGLWEGCDWEKVLQAKAAYTYGNAVTSEWFELIEKINDAFDDASAVLGENDAYADADAAKALRSQLEHGEVAESDENCEMQLAIVQAVIDGNDGDEARKEQIKKLVNQAIADCQ